MRRRRKGELRVKPHWVTGTAYGRWRFWLALIASLLAASCVGPRPVLPPEVKATNGPVCGGASYAADAPCLEQGEPAPFGGLLLKPQLAKDWLAEPKRLEAENQELRAANARDTMWLGIAIVGGVAASVAAAYAVYEFDHGLK